MNAGGERGGPHAARAYYFAGGYAGPPLLLPILLLPLSLAFVSFLSLFLSPRTSIGALLVVAVSLNVFFICVIAYKAFRAICLL